MNLFIIISELLYYIRRDIKKLAAIILIVFFAGMTAGFCAGKVIEFSIEETFDKAADSDET